MAEVLKRKNVENEMSVVGISGNARRPSKTRTLVEAIACELCNRVVTHDMSVFDLADLGPSLGAANELRDLAPFGQEIVAKIASADGLIIGSPVYKGAYAGLFKHFFDLIPPDCLYGKPVILAATGGGHRHALMIEHHLRPLFGFFEALSMPTVIYASDADFINGKISSDPVLRRIELAVKQLHQVVCFEEHQSIPN